MRSMLKFAADFLAGAKERGRTFAKVISDLARATPRGPTTRKFRNGAPLLEVKEPTTRVTLEQVNALRDALD